MKKRAALVLLLVWITGILMGCGNKTVAEVNGEKISREKLDTIVEMYVINYEGLYQKKIDPEKDNELMLDIEEMALDDLIRETLVLQEAQRRDLKADEKEVNEAIADFKKRIGSDKSYKQYLQKIGMSETDFSQEMQNQIVIQRLYEEVTNAISVSESEAKEYYRKNQSEFGNLRELKVSHILVETKAEAYEVIKKLKAGEDFAKLARKVSLESAAQQTGGALGYIHENSDLVSEFKESALKLKPGQITEEPTKTEFGYHVIKAFAEKPAKIEKYEDVREQVIIKAEQTKKEKAWRDFVNQEKDKAKIKNFLKRDRD